MLCSAFLVVALGAGTTGAVYSSLFASAWNMTEWFWQSALVVEDWLFIDGGEFYNQASLDSPNVTFYSLASSLRVDLSQPWTPSTCPGFWYGQNQFQDIRRPNLWYSPFDKLIYRWGGWPYWSNVTDEEKLWHFPYLSNGNVNWVQDTLPSQNGLAKNAQAPFFAATVATETTFYSLGGGTYQGYGIGGLVEFNYASGTWSNESSKGATHSGFYVFGEAAYATPFGQAGFLVFAGGEVPFTQTWAYEIGNDLGDMSNIVLYDIANGAWHHQQATGDIPPPRSEFCAVSAKSPDGATFEMFIYGGSTNQTWDGSNPDDDGYLHVYILSLPAFRWFKAPSSTPVRRASHTCQVIGNRQMLSIGGRQPSSLAELGAAPDPWPNGLGIFDMTALNWTQFYDPTAAAYEQSQIIQEYYNTTYQTPTWSDPVLASVFAFTPPPSASQAPSHSDTGAIAGGVVGGVGGIALLLLGGFLVLRHRRRRRTKNQIDPTSDKEFVAGQGPHEADGKGRYFEADARNSRAELASPVPELAGRKVFGVKRKPVASTTEVHELPGSSQPPASPDPSSQQSGAAEASASSQAALLERDSAESGGPTLPSHERGPVDDTRDPRSLESG